MRMPSLLVEAPGLLTTIQDLGRPGNGVFGVSPSGAADSVAFRLANLLVGNAPNTPALEMTLLGGSFVFSDRALIAVTGADFAPTLDGCPLELWRAHEVSSGSKIVFGPTKDFARCYLAISGGVRVPLFLGSASTHLLSRLGGFHGRALRKGDVLPLGSSTHDLVPRRIPSENLHTLKPRKTLRVTEGPQVAFFSEEALHTFFHSKFLVTEQSDRTGLRLDGPAITCDSPAEMITEGAPLGAIQITPSGQPIVLFVEQQTTGGYPKIANVIGVDLHRLGQLRPRTDIRFERISLAVARSLWIEQEHLLNHPRRLFA
jgi:antagonist of KipI